MEEVRYDSFGRRIPTFDRSAAGKKAAQTNKEKYGSDHYSKMGKAGGIAKTKGYFGKLKEEDPSKMRSIATAGGRKSSELQQEWRHKAHVESQNDDPETPEYAEEIW